MKRTRLSDAQRSIVEHEDGPLLVVAGPGSGKTRVLTERIRRLLAEVPGHFRILALTFTNKAAHEMSERLKDLGDDRNRAFIGTLHRFCLEILAERGKPIGVEGLPQIFEQTQDRKQILLEAALADPTLATELEGDAKARNQRLDTWLRAIALRKSHPMSMTEIEDPIEELVYDAYNAGLRASGAYDFDDLLLLAYQLLTEYPKIADFYRRLYRFVCIDEAQDLNEAQYAVIKALCGDDYRNVMMVGDPKQSIYGFNTSSPEYMERFQTDYDARKIELSDNFRSSQAVVEIARRLEPNYSVLGQLPIRGDVVLMVGQDEEEEARLVVDEIERLIENGHPDIENPVTPPDCAILGRNRFVLLAIEREMKNRELPYFKRLSSIHENESRTAEEFLLALRLYANPKDRIHLAELAKKWDQAVPEDCPLPSPQEVLDWLDIHGSGEPRSKAIVAAVKKIVSRPDRLEMMAGLKILEQYADGLGEDDRRALYEDTAVFAQEWDHYLRSGNGTRTIPGFMSSMALGTTQQAKRKGVALLTVHSSKGLEYEVVFVVGMADGVFPDYRVRGNAKAIAEERRNAFVAATRSKRLLYFSFPSQRRMPWGDTWSQQPSPYLREMGLAY